MSQLKNVLERIYSDFQDKIKPMSKSEFIKKYKTNNKENTAVGPKKPRTAYILFNTDKRKEVIAKNPDLKNPDIVKTLADMWRGLSNKQKEPFHKMAEEDKQRYAKDLSAFSITPDEKMVVANVATVAEPKTSSKTSSKKPVVAK